VHAAHAASLQSDCISEDELVLVREVPIDQKRKLERHKKRKENEKVARDGGVGEPVYQSSMIVAENVQRGRSFVVADDRLSQRDAGVKLQDHSEKSHSIEEGIQRRFVFFSGRNSKGENNAHNSRENERDDKMAGALVHAAFKKRVDVQQEDVGRDGEHPGDRREKEPDRGVDDDIGNWIAVEVAGLLVNPLPEIVQLANHLCRDLLKKTIKRYKFKF